MERDNPPLHHTLVMIDLYLFVFLDYLDFGVLILGSSFIHFLRSLLSFALFCFFSFIFCCAPFCKLVIYKTFCQFLFLAVCYINRQPEQNSKKNWQKEARKIGDPTLHLKDTTVAIWAQPSRGYWHFTE